MNNGVFNTLSKLTLLRGMGLTLLATGIICTGSSAQHLYQHAKNDPNKPTVFVSPVGEQALTVTLERGWHPVGMFHQGNEYKMEFMPSDESYRERPEKVTMITLVSSASADPAAYAANLKKFIETGKQSATFVWKPIKQTPTDVWFEYILKNHEKNPDQCEIWRVMKGKMGISTISYHIKKADLTQEERDRALHIVNTGELIQMSAKH